MRCFMIAGMWLHVRSVRGSWSSVRFVGRVLGVFAGFGGLDGMSRGREIELIGGSEG